MADNINWNSVQVEGVDKADFPDFCDAFFSYAEYVGGVQLSDLELEKLTEDHWDRLYSLALEEVQGR